MQFLSQCVLPAGLGRDAESREALGDLGSFLAGGWDGCRIRSSPQRSTAFIPQALCIWLPPVTASVAGPSSHQGWSSPSRGQSSTFRSFSLSSKMLHESTRDRLMLGPRDGTWYWQFSGPHKQGVKVTLGWGSAPCL